MLSMGIYRKKNRWYVRLPIQPDGRRPVRSLGPLITTRKEAVKAAQELAKRGVLDKLAHLDPSRRTIGELHSEFLRIRAGSMQKTSLRRYDVALRALMQSLGSNYLLRSITAKIINEWISARLAEGVSRAGVNSDLRHIKSALNQAVEWDWLEKPPKIKMLKLISIPRHLLPEQVELLLKAEKDPYKRRLWTFLIWTGCRRAEAFSMTWDKIRFEPYPMVQVMGKGNKIRWIPLLPAALDAIGEVKDIGKVWPIGGKSTWSHWFKKTARKAGLDDHRLHDLRHTAIVFMLSRGVSPKVVQEIVGHANFSTTEQYAKSVLSEAIYTEAMKGLKSE